MWISAGERQWWWRWRSGMVVMVVMVIVTTDAAPLEEERGRGARLLGWGTGGGGGGGVLQWFSRRMGAAGPAEQQLIEEGRRKTDRNNKEIYDNSNNNNNKEKDTRRNNNNDGWNPSSSGNKPKPSVPQGQHGTPIVLGGHQIGDPYTNTHTDTHDTNTYSNTGNTNTYNSLFHQLTNLPVPHLSVSHDLQVETGIEGISDSFLPNIFNFGYNSQPSSSSSSSSSYQPTHEYQQEDPKPKPTETELMVLSYPSIVKYMGQGFSALTKALRRFGERLGDNLANSVNLNSGVATLGNGVTALVDIQDANQKFPNIDKTQTSSQSGYAPGSSVSVSGSSNYHPSFSHHSSASFAHGLNSHLAHSSTSSVNTGILGQAFSNIQNNVNSGLQNMQTNLQSLGQYLNPLNYLSGSNRDDYSNSQGSNSHSSSSNSHNSNSHSSNANTGNIFGNINTNSGGFQLPGFTHDSGISQDGPMLTHHSSFSIGNGQGSVGGVSIGAGGSSSSSNSNSNSHSSSNSYDKRPGCC